MKPRLSKEEAYKLSTAERTIMFYRAHPVEAAKDLLNIDLMWFQRIALRSMWRHKYIMLLFGRGIGKTWLGAVFVVLYGMLYPGLQIGILAPSFKQTEFFFDKIADIYEASPYLRASCSKIQRSNFKALCKFNNGSFIEGLPLGTGEKVRGRRYNVIIVDEYASVDEEIIKKVIRPMMNVKKKGIDNKYIISGTAYYSWNHYYLQYLLYNLMSHKEPEKYALHEYTFEDVMCVPDPPFTMDEDVYAMSKMDTTEEIFSMENLCLFPVDNVGFFSARMIDACIPKDRDACPIEVIGDTKAYYTMGVDAARVSGGDNFSISIVKLNRGIKQFVHGFILNGATYQEMVYHIRRLCQEFNIIQIDLDAGGGGMTIRDLLMESYKMPDGKMFPPIIDMDDKDLINVQGIRMLKLVKFTRPVVNDLYMRLKADMQHKKIEFPVDIRRSSDRDLEKVAHEILETKRELLVIQAEGKGNYYTFSVPTQFKKDRATSLALAVQAANEHISQEMLRPAETEIGEGMWV